MSSGGGDAVNGVCRWRILCGVWCRWVVSGGWVVSGERRVGGESWVVCEWVVGGGLCGVYGVAGLFV